MLVATIFAMLLHVIRDSFFMFWFVFGFMSATYSINKFTRVYLLNFLKSNKENLLDIKTLNLSMASEQCVSCMNKNSFNLLDEISLNADIII